jgi:hypothetical protein
MNKTDARLIEILAPMVSVHGLELKEASFFTPKEFQATWKKSRDSVEIRISDYLIDAPDIVLYEFSKAVVMTMAKKKPVYGKAFLDWVTSDEYINSKRKIYLRRSRNLTGSPEGNERSMIDSLDRLLDSSLLAPDIIDNSFFSWTRTSNIRKMGFCSPMMRVVGISSTLDDLNVPEYVFDYVVYHECLHLEQGYRPGQRVHDRAFRDKEKKFPRYEEAERYLKEIGKNNRRL